MKFPILLLSLLVTTSAAVVAQQQHHRQLSPEHQRILRELLDDSDETEADREDLDRLLLNNNQTTDTDTPGLTGDRCGRDRPCARGLDCLRVPLLKRCYPVTCGVVAVQTLVDQAGFDLKQYGRELWKMAGIDDPQNVATTSDMFRSFPDRNLNLFNRNSSLLQRMMNTIQNNRPPMELFTESFNNCTNGAYMSSGDGRLSRTSVAGLAPYFGGSLELGLLGTYNADMYYAQGNFFVLYMALCCCFVNFVLRI